MYIKRKFYSEDSDKKKDKRFEKDLKQINKKPYDKISKLITSPAKNAMEGKIIKSAGQGALLGAGIGSVVAPITTAGFVVGEAVKAKKKGIPVGKHIKKFLAKNKNNISDIIKEGVRKNAAIYGLGAAGIKLGRGVSDKFDNYMERVLDINKVRSSDMSKEDFVKKHYGEKYLNKLKESHNDNIKE